MIEALFAIVGDIALLRVAVLILVFVLTYSLLLRVESLDHKTVVMLSIVASFIAVLGFSDQTVVSIIAGYGAIGTGILFLLPIGLLIALLFWRSNSVVASFVKLLAVAFVLIFIRIISGALDPFSSRLPFELEDVVGIIEFGIYILLFFFGFDVLAKTLFASGQERS